MAVQQFPPRNLSATTKYFTAASPYTNYEAVVELAAGTYQVSCISTTKTFILFFNGDTPLMSTPQTTFNGSLTVSLGQRATRLLYWTDTGTNIEIGITLTGAPAPFGAKSGTLDTITTSQTYTQTGPALVVLIGGGGGGGNGGGGQFAGGGAGGASGGVLGPLAVNLTGSTSVVIGSAGPAGGSGGTTSFGAFSVAWLGPNYAGSGTPTAANLAMPVKAGTTGGGGSGAGYFNGGTQPPAQGGGGNGQIGTGGGGGGLRGNGAAGTGYGAGGGGGGAAWQGPPPGVGAAGTQGVVYVLRNV